MSKYIYDYEVDGEKGKKGHPVGCDAPSACSESGFVILQLTNYLERSTHKLFFANFFCSADIVP